MPSKSLAQHDFMAMCAHSPNKVHGKCPPMKVAKEFSHADKGRHFPVKRVKAKR